MIRLVPMRSEDYRRSMERLIQEYAEDHIRTGRWTREEGPTEARKEVERLLPQGLRTPGHYLLSIVTSPGEERVGELWLAAALSEGPRRGFIYDLLIYAPFRRKGYAREGMLALEEFAREKGMTSLGLHVFAHNSGARALYELLGYRTTDLVMVKDLPHPSSPPK